MLKAGALVGGRYKINKLLGEGGTGNVYLAVDTALNDDIIALKILNQDYVKNEALFTRFRNEAFISRRLTHSNILRMYDFGEADSGEYYISMEYASGGCLSNLVERIRKNQCTFENMIRYVEQTALALSYAHKEGVTHRDLKPGNILLTDRDEVKVADFGLASALFVNDGLTKSGQTLGTPNYMSPEQIQGEEADGRADIYAFGILCFEFSTGRPPFTHDSWFQLASKHLTEPVPKDLLSQAEVPRWLQALIIKCLAKKPEDRYQTFEDVVAALEQRVESKHNVTAEFPVMNTPAVAEPKELEIEATPLPLAAGQLETENGFSDLELKQSSSSSLTALDTKLSSTARAFNCRISREQKEKEKKNLLILEESRARHETMLNALMTIRKSLRDVAGVDLGERFGLKLALDDWQGWPRMVLRLTDSLNYTAEFPTFQVLAHDRKDKGVIEIVSGGEKDGERAVVSLADEREAERLPWRLRQCVRSYLDIIGEIVLAGDDRPILESDVENHLKHKEIRDFEEL